MSPDEFDELHDETLSGRLGALAPSEFEIDADAALGSMRPAFQRARSRRRLAIASSTLGVFAIVAAGAVVLQQQPTSHVHIESRTPTTLSTPTTRRSTPTATTQPRVVTPPPTTPHRSTTTLHGTTNTGTVEHPTPTSPNSTATTPDDHGGSTPSTSSTPTTAPALSTKTYTSVGGNATIRFANGSLTLVSHRATAGYATEIHTNKPDDIELRFSKGNAESRIRVRVQNGRIEPEITEK